MSKDVVLFGIGDFAQVASVYLEHDSPHKVAAFTVHEAFRSESELRGKPIAPFERILEDYPPEQCDLFIAMGFSKLNKPRAEIYRTCKDLGYKLITYVHSKVSLWGEFEIGDNCFIFENNTVQPFVKIGCNTIVWSGNHIGHHSTIGNHCFLTSHSVISGSATIEDNCFIGVNSTIRDGITVGRESVIGAGSLILQNVAPNSVFQGIATEVSRVPSHRLRAV